MSVDCAFRLSNGIRFAKCWLEGFLALKLSSMRLPIIVGEEDANEASPGKSRSRDS